MRKGHDVGQMRDRIRTRLASMDRTTLRRGFGLPYRVEGGADLGRNFLDAINRHKLTFRQTGDLMDVHASTVHRIIANPAPRPTTISRAQTFVTALEKEDCL